MTEMQRRLYSPLHDEQKVLTAQSGFSLIELVVVIALIMVLLSIAAPQLLNYIEQGRKASCLANRRHLEQDERVRRSPRP